MQVSSGEVLEADIVVTATGFNLAVFGDIPFTVDGEPVDFAQRVTWRGMMISGVPNMAYAFGYFRHSWTLRVDLVNDVVARICRAHGRAGARRRWCPTLRPEDADMPLRPWSDPENFNAGYVTALAGPDVQAGRPRAVDPHAGARRTSASSLPKADLDDGLQYR